MRVVIAFTAALIISGLALAQEKSATPPTTRSQAAPSEDSSVYQIGNGVKPPRAIDMPSPKLTEEEKKPLRSTEDEWSLIIFSPQ
jgi:hypothetical protein